MMSIRYECRMTIILHQLSSSTRTINLNLNRGYFVQQTGKCTTFY